MVMVESERDLKMWGEAIKVFQLEKAAQKKTTWNYKEIWQILNLVLLICWEGIEEPCLVVVVS